MKKLHLLLILLAISLSLPAQWTDDPAQNNRIANCNRSAAEVYVSTDKTTGDTYVQWHYQGENGWSPWLQRLNAEGVSQWDRNGIHVTTPDFATWSPGYAMTAVEGGAVTVFRTLGPHHWAVKVNADGTFPWGEHGLVLFNGEGGGRSEVLAGDDGGVWALGTDMDSTFLQYVNADGTLRNYVTIKDPSKKCTNGVLVPADNGVFVVYAKQTLQGYTSYNKEIYLAGYNKDGEQIVPETLLLGSHTTGGSYVHYAVSDGIGGGYVYTWHNHFGDVYNTYVTHFNATGTPTIDDMMGIPVHSPDYYNYYVSADVTVDPLNHDLLIAYLQKDAYSQSQYRIYINRITASGERLWGDGILVADHAGHSYGDLSIDAFEYGEGFAVVYGTGLNTVQAVGYDNDGNVLWNTTMSSTSYNKTISENSSGFHLGQNIVTWVNRDSGDLFGQNIGYDGTIGEVTPPTPPFSCDPPTNFQGFYYYENNTDFGVHLCWNAPETLPLHYNLYLTDPHGCETVMEIEPTVTECIHRMSILGDVIFRLTAVYENCESDNATTPDGEDHLTITLTSTPETVDHEIAIITQIYTTHGQSIRNTSLEDLSCGVYIVQGWSSSGKLITKKIVIK